MIELSLVDGNSSSASGRRVWRIYYNSVDSARTCCVQSDYYSCRYVRGVERKRAVWLDNICALRRLFFPFSLFAAAAAAVVLRLFIVYVRCCSAYDKKKTSSQHHATSTWQNIYWYTWCIYLILLIAVHQRPPLVPTLSPPPKKKTRVKIYRATA